MSTKQEVEAAGTGKPGFFGRLFQKLDAKMKAKAEESASCCCCEDNSSKEKKQDEKCCGN